MTHEEYNAAIKKQQSLIRKLFSNRRRRSEVIDEVTQERYGHLVGKFFRPQGDHFKGSATDIDYYICGISTESNYVMSDTVYVELDCRYMGRMYQGADFKIAGMDIGHQSFRFKPSDNLDEILAPMFVDKTKAIKAIDDCYTEMLNNYLRKSGKD